MDATPTTGEPRCLISRRALLHNAALLRKTLPPSVKICAVIKADAYGHGARLVADTLCNFTLDALEPPLIDALAVADLDEAADLGDSPVPILVLRPVENALLGPSRDKLESAIRAGWTLTLASGAAADDLARIARAAGRRAKIQIMIDTGMSRAGVSLEQSPSLIARIQSHDSLRLVSGATHFACADEPENSFNAEQLRRFLAATDACAGPRPLRSAANSAAIFFHPQSHLDLVRPGIALYGIDPLSRPSVDRPLRPVMTWLAPLVGIRDLEPGAGIGYGQTWIADRPTRVALVPVGYADGYPRALSNRGVMILHNQPAPVVGRVSMDLTVIDISRIPHAIVGDEAIVLDSDPLSPASAYALAEKSGTIPYEILSRIGPRIARVAADEIEPAELSRGGNLIPTVAHDSQHVQEDVDEIQIER